MRVLGAELRLVSLLHVPPRGKAGGAEDETCTPPAMQVRELNVQTTKLKDGGDKFKEVKSKQAEKENRTDDRANK